MDGTVPEVQIATEAREAFCLFLTSGVGPPTDQEGQIKYPCILGVLGFLNQWQAPDQLQAAAIIVCYDFAGAPRLDLKVRSRILGPKARVAARFFSFQADVGQMAFDDKIHRLCQLLDRRLSQDCLMVLSAIVSQLCQQIKLSGLRLSKASDDLLTLLHDNLARFQEEATDQARTLVAGLIDPNQTRVVAV